MNYLAYKAGYKYQVEEVFTYETGITGRGVTLNRFLTLTGEGRLIIQPGYAWDGASGPAINTLNFRRASLVHDALYQLIREDALPFSFRDEADELLIRICREDGMWAIRRAWVKAAVRTFGANVLEHANPTLYAPEMKV